MMVVHKKSAILQKVDDTMAVLHTHAIAGSLGGILSGIFAEPRLNFVFYGAYNKYIGLFYGFNTKQVKLGFRQLGVQLLGIIFVTLINVIVTSLICVLLQYIVPLRMSEEDMAIGDEAAHGEEAYAIWGQGEKMDSSKYDIEIPVSTKHRHSGQIEMA